MPVPASTVGQRRSLALSTSITGGGGASNMGASRRRSSVSITIVEIPGIDTSGSGPPSNGSGTHSKRSSLSASPSSSQVFNFGTARKSSGAKLHLPAEVLQNSNPYLQQPRRSLENPGVRRLSYQDLELIRRETSAQARRKTTSAALQRTYTERDEDLNISPDASPCPDRRAGRGASPQPGRKNGGGGTSPRPSPRPGRQRKSSQGTDSTDGLASDDDLILPAVTVDGGGGSHTPRSGSPSTMRKSVSFTQALSNFISGGNAEEIQQLEDQILFVMDDDNTGQSRRMFHEGELIIWDPATGLGDMMAPGSMKQPKVRQLLRTLTDWINDTLCARRVIVQSVFQDLYDGQVLEELMEVLTDTHAARTESFCIAERLKKQRLERMLAWIDKELGRVSAGPDEDSWNLERIFQQDFISTIHLLVALCRHYAADTVQLPEDVVIEVHRNEMQAETLQLVHKKWREHLTGVAGHAFGTLRLTSPATADVFDKFFLEAPHKVEEAERVLLKFTNHHLAKLSDHRPLADFRRDYRDGTVLVMLLAVLGGFCVRLFEFRIPVSTDVDRAHNLLLALRLMRDADIEHAGVDRPDEIIAGSSKDTMRVLFPIFKQYKYAI